MSLRHTKAYSRKWHRRSEQARAQSAAADMLKHPAPCHTLYDRDSGHGKIPENLKKYLPAG